MSIKRAEGTPAGEDVDSDLEATVALSPNWTIPAEVAANRANLLHWHVAEQTNLSARDLFLFLVVGGCRAAFDCTC